MRNNRSQRLLRTFIGILLIVSGVWAFNIWSNYQEQQKEAPMQFVTRIHDFYVDSGYDNKADYESDAKKLETYKQKILDNLTYKHTVEYIAIQKGVMSGMINNDLLNLIDETYKLLYEGITRVPKSEYKQIDSTIIFRDNNKIVSEKEPTPTEMVFQNLLK